MKSAHWKVGIDLAPAARLSSAPGTARHVTEQARALFKLEVPWTWIPVLSPGENPLTDEIAHLNPFVSRTKKASLHATFELGKIWRGANCDLGFSTAFFVPLHGPPAIANYFDANFYENVDAWHRKKQLAKHLLTRALLRHSVQRSNYLLIDSEYGRKRMSEIFPRYAEKFVVAPCGFRQPGPPSETPPAWASQSQHPFFLYVGSFSDNKNQRNLLKAWHLLQTQHPNAPHLVMIGPLSSAYREQVIAPLHQQLPRPEEVIIPGFTKQEHLNWAFWNALGYLQPSFAEGFGLPVLEAMSCDLPVACSDSTSLPEVAGDAALLFDPTDPKTIAHCAERIWKDESLRQQMIGRGHGRLTQFTWEKNAKIVADTILARLTS